MRAAKAPDPPGDHPRPVLYAGGFACKGRRWFLSENPEDSGRLLRRALVRGLSDVIPEGELNPEEELAALAKTIAAQLREAIEQMKR